MDIRLLIIGGGAVVKEYYLPALASIDLTSSTTVVEANEATLSDLKIHYPWISGVKAGFTEYFSYTSPRSFDAVIIALPNILHAEATKIAIKYGFHVLCEKPLATTSKDCLDLEKIARESSQKLGVGMVRRYIPSFGVLHRAYLNGLIGDLLEVDIQDGEPYAWLSNSGSYFSPQNGGVLMDMGVHFLDLVRLILGDLLPVSYKDDYRGGVEANCDFELLSSHGKVPIVVRLSRTRTLLNRILFKGNKGELIVNKNNFEYCLWLSYEKSLGVYAKLYPEQNFKGGDWPANLHSCFSQQIKDFLAFIRGDSETVVSAIDAAQIISLIEWAYLHRLPLAEDKNVLNNAISGYFESVKETDKVVVTGGTGFIGQHLVGRLSLLGFKEIVVPVRNYKTCAAVARYPVKIPLINFHKFDEIKDCIRGAKYVYHLAYGRDGANLSEVTIEGTKSAVNAAIECGVEAIIILSTMYVFGQPNTDHIVDESWPYNPVGGDYGRSKAKMERWCLARAKNSSKTRIVVLNPSCVYGPGGTTYVQLPLVLANQGRFCWIGKGDGIANYTYIDNLLDAMLLCTVNSKAHGHRFLINDGFCSWRDFLTPILGVHARPLPSYDKEALIKMDRQNTSSLRDLINHILNDTESVALISKMPVLIYSKRFLFKVFPYLRAILDEIRLREGRTETNKSRDAQVVNPPLWLVDLFGTASTRFSSDKAKGLLGWRPLISLKEGQERTVDWLRNAGLLDNGR